MEPGDREVLLQSLAEHAASLYDDPRASRYLMSLARQNELRPAIERAEQLIAAARRVLAQRRYDREQGQPYVKQWRAALYESRLRFTTRAILLHLSTYATPEGTDARPSARRLGRELNIRRQTVDAHLSTAAKEGWIVRSERGRSGGKGWRGYDYTLTIPTHSARTTSPQEAATLADPAPAGFERTPRGQYRCLVHDTLHRTPRCYPCARHRAAPLPDDAFQPQEVG